MARTRNLKPGFFTNDQLSEIEPLGRLLFQGLWCHADRAGRLLDRSKKLKAEILPYDRCNVDELLEKLTCSGFIRRYIVGEVKYIQVVTFSKHQNPHVKEPPSEIPAPDEYRTSTVQAEEIPERAGPSSFPCLPSTLTLEPSTSNGKPGKPNLNEVVLYCHERKNQVDPQKWFDYYSSNGWKVGRNSMKDWKAAVRTWERNGNGGNGNGTERLSAGEQLKQRNREAAEHYQLESTRDSS
jgi:hypothetical protein